jgi:EAL domain-containing protein (putative c-di-GMP-specific phosphodiesterase class I)
MAALIQRALASGAIVTLLRQWLRRALRLARHRVTIRVNVSARTLEAFLAARETVTKL